MVKTVEFQPARLSPKECKSCGEVATLQSFDTKGNDTGPSIFHCPKCRVEGRRLAKWFIKPVVAVGSIEDFLG